MKLTKEERKILIEIFKSSSGLFLFTLHRQLNLSTKDLFISIENLKENGLILVNEDRVTLTKEGIDYSTKSPLKTKLDLATERLIKAEYQGKRIDINEFYIPRNFEK
jgi:hypothetical protein